MAKDFKLLAEAYSKVYEANDVVTGSVAGNTSPGPQIGIPKETGPMPADTGFAGMASVKLAVADSSKILKNVSEVYGKTREVAEILKKYNIPGSIENLKLEASRLANLANQIVSMTPESTDVRVKNKLYANLDKDLIAVIQGDKQPMAQPQVQGAPVASQATQIPTAY